MDELNPEGVLNEDEVVTTGGDVSSVNSEKKKALKQKNLLQKKHKKRYQKYRSVKFNPEQIKKQQEVQNELVKETSLSDEMPTVSSSIVDGGNDGTNSMDEDNIMMPSTQVNEQQVSGVQPIQLEELNKLEDIIKKQNGFMDTDTVDFLKNPPTNNCEDRSRHEEQYPGLYSDLSEFISQSYKTSPPVNEIPDWVLNTDGIQAGQNWELYHSKFQLQDAMNLDMRYLRAFYWKENLVWFHVCVRVPAWKSFCLKFLARYGYKLHFLPYWCLCNGGGVLHRHMICVLRDSDKDIMNFKFPSIVVGAMPADSSNATINNRRNAKFKIEIKRSSTLHLINAINYVSSPQSTCLVSSGLPAKRKAKQFDSNDTDIYHSNANSSSTTTDDLSDGCSTAVHHPGTRSNKRGLCHFHINRYLGPYCRLYGALIHPQGVSKYLDSMYKQCVPDGKPSLRREKNKTKGRWMINCRDIANEKSLVCPIPRNHMFQKIYNTSEFWRQLDHQTDTYREPCIGYVFVGLTVFRVIEDDKLLKLSEKEWVEFQMRNDNIFFFNMGDESFFLGKKAQDFMNRYSDEFNYWQGMIRDRDNSILQQKEEIKNLKQKLEQREVKVIRLNQEISHYQRLRQLN